MPSPFKTKSGITTSVTPSFVTLVQVTESNSCCPCSAPTTVQILNVGEAEATFTNANVVITKII